MVKELEQTRGTFKLKGLAKGLDRDNVYEEDVREGGKYSGTAFRKLNIGLQTASDNQLRLGIFAYEPEEVFLWNNEKRKKNKKYKGERMPYEEYLDKKEILKENGTAILQARVGVEYDEKDKLISEGMTNYEASELIYENVDNDDGLYVEGQISYSTFKNRQDEEVTAVNYNIGRLFKAKEPFDLDDEEYKEQNYYEQEFVYVDSMINKEEKKLIVIGRIIDYNKNFLDATFSVNYGEDEGMEKLAKNIKKQFKFGDLVTAWGEILNQAISQDVEEEQDSNLSALGGKSQPSYATRTNVTYNREMTIEGILGWEKKFYSEEDFAAEELVEEDEDDFSELGGKKKKELDDPFSDDDDPFSDDDDDDEDLPF